MEFIAKISSIIGLKIIVEITGEKKGGKRLGAIPTLLLIIVS